MNGKNALNINISKIYLHAGVINDNGLRNHTFHCLTLKNLKLKMKIKCKNNGNNFSIDPSYEK